MKIDLGGVVLGAIIGIGALLIVPKVVNAFNGGGYGGVGGGSYGGNYRSITQLITVIGSPELQTIMENVFNFEIYSKVLMVVIQSVFPI